jgi:hypothetical protein
VAEEHGHELAPAGEAMGMALGALLHDGALKLLAGKQLQHLAENAGYSCHGGGVLPVVHVFSTQTVAEFRRRRSNPNLDKSGMKYNAFMLPLEFDIPEVIILSHQRSGTHFFQSCLMSHPKIRGRGECFDRYEKARLSRVECGSEDLALFRNESGKINVGILMYNQIPSFESWFGVLRGYKLIHLIT